MGMQTSIYSDIIIFHYQLPILQAVADKGRDHVWVLTEANEFYSLQLQKANTILMVVGFLIYTEQFAKLLRFAINKVCFPWNNDVSKRILNGKIYFQKPT